MSLLDKKQNRMFKAGDIIFRAGDEGGSMFVIQEGEVEIFILVNKQKIVLASLGKGAVFGEMALVDNSPRSASALAIKNCTCKEISRLFFSKRLEDVPKWMRSFYQIMVERLRDTNRMIDTTLSKKNSRQIVYLLADKLQNAEQNNLGHVSVPWNKTVDEFSFILNIPKKHVEKIFTKLAISSLAKGKIGEYDRRVLMTDSLDDFNLFADYCKDQYFNELETKYVKNDFLDKKMSQFLFFIKEILKEQLSANDIDRHFMADKCEQSLGKSVDHFETELSILIKKNVIKKKIREDGSSFYDVDREKLFGIIATSEKTVLFKDLDIKLLD